MCVSRCVRCVGISLVPLAIVCVLSNILLLFPELKIHFLLEGHVTREASWATGLWGSGFLVLLGARVFVQNSNTRGCCAFRTKLARKVLSDQMSSEEESPYGRVEKSRYIVSGVKNMDDYRHEMLSQVIVSGACVLAAAFCCLVSLTGLSQGPLCRYNSTSGYSWGVPLQPHPDSHAGYLYNSSLWSGVCLEPSGVVQWNLVLFGVMGGASGLQVLLCLANVFNSLLGLILGPGVCKNQVVPVSV